MAILEEHITSILDGKESINDAKLIDVRYVVEPELKDRRHK